MSAIAIPTIRPSSISAQSIEPEDLHLIEDKGLFELVGGRLVEKKLGLLENVVAGKITCLLGNHLSATNSGGMVVPEQSFQITPNKPKQVRRPDIAFISAARVPVPLPTGHVMTVPDLAVEIVSPNDKVNELDEKLDEYRAAGIPLVWVVSPNARHVRIHRGNQPIAELRDGDVLTGDPVLPGFAVKVTELFPLASAAPSAANG